LIDFLLLNQIIFQKKISRINKYSIVYSNISKTFIVKVSILVVVSLKSRAKLARDSPFLCKRMYFFRILCNIARNFNNRKINFFSKYKFLIDEKTNIPMVFLPSSGLAYRREFFASSKTMRYYGFASH
jgi:hypothetical protein